MSQDGGSERRTRTRVDFRGPVEIRVEGRLLAVTQTRDVSHNGLFAVTKERAPLGTPCLVTIPLGGSDKELAVEIKGVIARQEETGLAISFKEMDERSFYHLRNLIRYNAENADEVDSELTKPGF